MSPATLDHLGISVGDLVSARTAFERLGFATTERSAHFRVEGGSARKPLGTANHCAMLRQGYIELIGPLVSGSAAPRIVAFDLVADRHILAVRVPSAPAWRQLLGAMDMQLPDPSILERDLTTPALKTVRFRNLYPGERFPEMRLILIEHQTADLLWNEELLDHPNTAVGLSGITLGVDEPVESAGRLSELTRCAVTQCDGTATLALARGWVKFVRRTEPQDPAVHAAVEAIDIAVADMDRCQHTLQQADVAARSHDGMLVAPSGLGPEIRFHKA